MGPKLCFWRKNCLLFTLYCPNGDIANSYLDTSYCHDQKRGTTSAGAHTTIVLTAQEEKDCFLHFTICECHGGRLELRHLFWRQNFRFLKSLQVHCRLLPFVFLSRCSHGIRLPCHSSCTTLLSGVRKWDQELPHAAESSQPPPRPSDLTFPFNWSFGVWMKL